MSVGKRRRVRNRGYSWGSNVLAQAVNKSELRIRGLGRGIGRYAGDYGRRACVNGDLAIPMCEA
jgi:hypothetical protein